ncbi:hypothetical protein JCM3765_006897 [Sporobolomyces pararoseus]
MNNSTTFHSLTPSLPTLPLELIDEILTQESLSKSDLARCCLVSRQFLQSSRPVLYSTLTIELRRASRLLERDPAYTVQRSSHSLLETLRSLPDLRITTKLVFKGVSRLKPRASSVRPIKPSKLLQETLQLLPRLNQVSFRGIKVRGADLILTNEGSRWKRLHSDSQVGLRQSAEESPFKNLEELSCSIGTTNGVNTIYLPPSLKVLNIIRIYSRLVMIKNAPTSILRSLRLGFSSLCKLRNVPQLPHLVHLRLDMSGEDECVPGAPSSRAVNTVASCRSLISLSLYLEHSSYEPLVPHFLRQLPSTLLYLNFPGTLPLFDTVLPIVESGTLDSIRAIRFPATSLTDGLLNLKRRVRGEALELNTTLRRDSVSLYSSRTFDSL